MCGGCQRIMQKGFEETMAGAICGTDASFHPIAEGHELIDLGNDAVLFGEGRDGNR